MILQTRPIDVSEHWSTVLLKEWAVQASLEQDLDLPVSVIASADSALQAKGQIGFIDLFTQPLFEAVSDVLPGKLPLASPRTVSDMGGLSELQCYADWCAENRSLWQQRLDHFAEAIEASQLVQPIVESAVLDERFRTLFPLSLPASLIGARGLEPGPVITPTTPHGQTSQTESGLAETKSSANEGAESPAAKAMRAVYHPRLLAQRHRLSSWTRGILIPGVQSSDWTEARRMSTPETTT